MTITPLLIALLGGIVAVGVVHWTIRRKLAKRLDGRASLTEDEFAALFEVPLEGRVAVSVRLLLAPWVKFDVSLVRPGDEFCGDLLLDALDGMDPEEFLLSVEKQWRVQVPRDEAAQLKTIAQLAAAVARHLSGTQSNMSINTDSQQQEAASRRMLRAGYLQR